MMSSFFSVLTMTILCGFVEWCLLLEMFNQSPIQPINLTKKCQSRKANSHLIYPGPLIFVPVAANSYPQLTKECRWHQGIHCIIWTPWVTHSHFSEELDDFDIENIRILSCLELLLPTLEATFKTRSCKISWGDLSETLGGVTVKLTIYKALTDLLSALDGPIISYRQKSQVGSGSAASKSESWLGTWDIWFSTAMIQLRWKNVQVPKGKKAAALREMEWQGKLLECVRRIHSSNIVKRPGNFFAKSCRSLSILFLHALEQSLDAECMS